MKYRCEATSVEGFVQQIASNYLPHGYWFYVSGVVPDGKDPVLLDQKLIHNYGIGISRQARARRKQAGLANLHYIRFERYWVVLATHGVHKFFEEEASLIRDARRAPIHFQGYSISVKQGNFLQKVDPDEPPVPDSKLRVRVLIGRERYRDLKSHFLSLVTHRTAETLGRELFRVPFEPYAPIRKQLLNLLRQINSRRQQAGYERLPTSVLRYRRRIVKPFEGRDENVAA